MVSTEKAIEIDTAKGSPSGIATITIATAVVKILRILRRVSSERRLLDDENIILKTKKRVIATKIAKPAM
jgi:hypothetical protein